MSRLLVVVAVLALSGCGRGSSGSDESLVTSAPSSVVTTVASTSTPSQTTVEVTSPPGASTSQPAGPASATTAPEELVVFVATLEELLEGTGFEGAALEDPDVFVATGRLFCERLDAGDEPDGVLSAFLDELAGGVDAATDDELVLAGALLGAAVGALCPEHAGLLG